MERLYFLYTNGQQTGPFTLAQARQQQVARATMVWYEGLSGWVAIELVEELKDLVLGAPSAPAPTPSASGAGPASSAPGTSSGPAGYSSLVTSHVPGYASNAVLADELEKHHRLMITYILCWIGGAIVVGILAAVMAAADAEAAAIFTGVLGGMGILALIILNIIHFCKFLYRCWEVAIARTGFTEFPAGQAVGLLFVPLFNLYWYFKAYHTLSELLYQATGTPPYSRNYAPNKGLALTFCILNLVSIVPWLGSIAALVNIILWFVIMGEYKRSCKHLLQAPVV